MNGGYVLDSTYGSNYSAMQAPVALALAAAAAAVFSFDAREAFRMVEFGCGTGVTLCVLADAYPQARFTGIDINPAAIEAARALACSGGLANVDFVVADLLEMDPRSIGPADIVSSAGLFSWLDRARQDAIFAAAAELLKPSGLLHVHYASLPGSSQAQVLHDALAWLAPSVGSSVDRLEQAIAVMADIEGKSARFFSANMRAASRLKGIRAHSLADEAHEILSGGEGPSWFGAMARRAQAFGLAPLADVETLRPLRGGTIEEVIRRETVNDLQGDRAVRQDIFVLDARPAERAGGWLLGLQWYVPPRVRAGGPKPIAEALKISESLASTFASMLDAGATGEDVGACIGRPVAPMLLEAARRGILMPQLRRFTKVPSPLQLSRFNAHVLRLGLMQDHAPPLAARGVGTRVALPLLDRLRLLALSGGNVDEILDQHPNVDQERLRTGLTPAALKNFGDAAAAELARLGLFIGPE